MRFLVWTVVLAVCSHVAGAAALLQMTQTSGGTSQVMMADASVTTSSQAFDSGVFGGSNAGDAVYKYGMSDTSSVTYKRPQFDDSLSFSSTTSKFQLTSVAMNYYQYTTSPPNSGNVNVELFVNNVTANSQPSAANSSVSGVYGVLTWDLTTLASSLQNLSSYTFKFVFTEQGSGRVTEFSIDSTSATASQRGILINGTSSPAPEPAMLAAGGLAAWALLRRRRSGC